MNIAEYVDVADTVLLQESISEQAVAPEKLIDVSIFEGDLTIKVEECPKKDLASDMDACLMMMEKLRVADTPIKHVVNCSLVKKPSKVNTAFTEIRHDNAGNENEVSRNRCDKTRTGAHEIAFEVITSRQTNEALLAENLIEDIKVKESPTKISETGTKSQNEAIYEVTFSNRHFDLPSCFHINAEHNDQIRNEHEEPLELSGGNKDINTEFVNQGTITMECYSKQTNIKVHNVPFKSEEKFLISSSNGNVQKENGLEMAAENEQLITELVKQAGNLNNISIDHAIPNNKFLVNAQWSAEDGSDFIIEKESDVIESHKEFGEESANDINWNQLNAEKSNLGLVVEDEQLMTDNILSARQAADAKFHAILTTTRDKSGVNDSLTRAGGIDNAVNESGTFASSPSLEFDETSASSISKNQHTADTNFSEFAVMKIANEKAEDVADPTEDAQKSLVDEALFKQANKGENFCRKIININIFIGRMLKFVYNS